MSGKIRLSDKRNTKTKREEINQCAGGDDLHLGAC
jgi:hypothetical protein